MPPTLKVDFHLHSNLSDGYYSPEILAEKLASEDIHFAALTDHNNISGVKAFSEVFSRKGGYAVSGVEISAFYQDVEVHILSYGFDPDNPRIQSVLKNICPFRDVINAIHESGGLAFLAHPLQTYNTINELKHNLRDMKKDGLDGIEALYGAYSPDERNNLVNLADKFGLLVSAGSDFHGTNMSASQSPGAEIDSEHWKNLRKALCIINDKEGNGNAKPLPTRNQNQNRVNIRWFLLHILVPAVLTVTLFLSAIFGFIIPIFEENLLAKKKEMIKELTNSAWSVLAEYDKEYKRGEMSLADAQKNAIERIKYLRYGKEGKDYFWITDMHPNMIMHPYREDLNGHDLSNFKDPAGDKLFVEFVKVVEKKEQGYVGYVWQWKDDPERLEPKESYVRGFKPWGWIIGTGIYIEDVKNEIETITQKIIDISVVISLLIGMLLIYITHQSLIIEHRRSQAEKDLTESHEKYRMLVEASTEGTLMLIGRRCVYANKKMIEIIGYSESELRALDIYDIFPNDNDKNVTFVKSIELFFEGAEIPDNLEAAIKRKSGTFIEALITFTKFEMADKKGCVIVVKDMRRHKEIEEKLGESLIKYKTLTDTINIGVFRAHAADEFSLIEANPSAKLILGIEHESYLSSEKLFDFFTDSNEKERFGNSLLNDGSLKDTLIQIKRKNGLLSTVSISAVLIKDKNDKPLFCDGILEDVTERKKSETLRDSMIYQLQTSLLFLNEKITNNMRSLVCCPFNCSIIKAAEIMNNNKYSAICITSNEGDVIGIVTDQDFKARVILNKKDFNASVFEIMSSPIISISANALVYEAILLMKEKNIRHLIVKDMQGKTIGIVRNSELIRFSQYSSIILMQEIQNSTSVDKIIEARERLPGLAKALINSGVQLRNLAHIISAVSDAVANRMITLAIEEIGAPPVRFAFMAFGSEGREEQTLLTDQDNGIVYEDPDETKSDEVRQYFIKLGEVICGNLDKAGYKFCKGDSMAKNPKWNQPLSVWKRYFTKWIKEPNSQELLKFNIFFDFRSIYGDIKLINEISNHINQILKNEKPFFFHLAKNSLQYKLPLGIFGQIVPAASGGNPNMLNIKDVLLPMVNFARLYALQYNVKETNTIDRLKSLYETQIIRKDFYQDFIHAYEFFMLLRYRKQIADITDSKPLNNHIDLKSLTHNESSVLKEALSNIAVIQKKIAFDYPGAAL